MRRVARDVDRVMTESRPSLGDILDMHGQTEEVRANANFDTPMLQSVYTPRAYTSTMGPLHVLDLTNLVYVLGT